VIPRIFARLTKRSSTFSQKIHSYANGCTLPEKKVAFQGFACQNMLVSFGERAQRAFVQPDGERGELKAPIVIRRDHLDAGSVASPYRETEKMLMGSDAISIGHSSTSWLTLQVAPHGFRSIMWRCRDGIFPACRDGDCRGWNCQS